MCKYCEIYNENSIFWQTYKLYENIKGENYICMDLEILQNPKERKAKIIVESCINDLVNRGMLEINYCPMCGRKLGDD